MKIGVDLRVLQVGHQYRGIGEVAKRSLNGIFKLAVADEEGSQPEFVFYEYEGLNDPKELLDIPKGLSFEEVNLGLQPLYNPNRTLFDKLQHKFRMWYGNPVTYSDKCDVFLQFDYALGVPKHPRTVLVKHDIIPYIFWNDYFTSPWIHFKHKAARTTIRTLLHNYEYKRVLRRSVNNAWKILCVSSHTKNDLKKYLHVPVKKMIVVHLGVEEKTIKTGAPKSKVMPTKPYLLFIGAVDARRRRVDDIVAAYNNLKAAGNDIQLVLAGENFQSPEKVPNEVVRNAILDSSYKNDILTLGYIDDATKQALFKGAIAFVFPTTYEGFGIPILEAMLMSCPVITYKNSSTAEVGSQHAIYAHDWQSIMLKANAVIGMSDAYRAQWVNQAHNYAAGYTWDRTATKIYNALLK